jgi:hypothetical protein
MDLNTFKEYLNIHLISLTQDYEQFYEDYLNDTEYDPSDIDNIRGQIKATRHLIGVLNG